MAAYSFTASAIYLSDGSFATNLIAPNTIKDGEDTGVGSTTFEIGDTLTYETGGAGDVSYLGTATLDGNLYFYAEFPSGDIQVFGNDFPTPAFPANISAFTLNPGASFPVCFAVGTWIATVSGETVVEHLRIGELICTSNGRLAHVKWIGRQTVHKLFSGPHMQPVRIRADALGGGLPHSDLTVTADHGMVIDGLVINASALVNGGSIDWVPMDELPDRVTYYHIETENHDVILANGAPAETFVDIPGRMAFDNYQEYLDLYGTERSISEMDRPRISSRRLLSDDLRARLGIVDEVIDFDLALTA